MSLRFAFRTYRRPLRLPLRTAHGLWAEREGLLLRVEGEGGVVRYAEVAPIPWFGTETLAEASEACAKIGDRLTPEIVAAVPTRFSCLHFALANLLADPAPNAMGSGRLPVAALLPAGRTALDVLDAKLEAGFLAFKWKVGVARPEEEMPLLDDMLARLPKYAKLRLDANGAWSNREATRWLEFCAERPVEFLEQPVTDADALLGMAEDYPVKLALDESVTGLAAALEWQKRGWSGVFVIKPALAGPLSELVRWAHATKPDLVLSSAIESALARAQILRVALAEKLTSRALGFGVGEIFGDRIWDGPMIGPLLDGTWAGQVNAEDLWNATS